MRGLIALALVLGCSGTDPQIRDPGPVTADAGASEVEGDPFPFPTGLFAVKEAKEVADHCGNMQWVSETVAIDPAARTLYAAPDDRLYQVSFDGASLIARGLFNDTTPPQQRRCPTETYVELWRLDAKGADRATGYVTTYAHFRPDDCLHACKAVYAVILERAPPSDDGDD